MELLVEEPSMRVVLETILPRLLSGRASFRVIDLQSRQRLLQKLPDFLRGYARRMTNEALRLVVLVDNDRDDCRLLKARLERLTAGPGVPTRTAPREDGSFVAVNRIVVEELEAWFLGDPEALRAAFPRLPDALERKAGLRDPDRISGGTWERLHRELQEAGYYRDLYPKIEVARRVAPHLLPQRNRSPSFQAFRTAVQALLAPCPRIGMC
jgi:hypothetical protein